MEERSKFEERFDSVQKEFLVLTGSDVSAGKGGKDELWVACVKVLAIVDVATGELIKEHCCLEWQLTEQECRSNKKIHNLQKETIYLLRVQESLPSINQYTGKEERRGHYLWVRKVLKRNCREERLHAILAEYQRPVTIHPEGCDELLLDKSLGMFSGEGSWNGSDCLIHLDVDGEGTETAQDACSTLKNLMEHCEEWDAKARAFAAKELTENANDWHEDEDGEKITEEQFAKRLIVSEVCVSVAGRFDIYYDDDEMFWGHVVIVNGNIEDGIEDATIAG